MHKSCSVELRRKTRRPPGRSRRAASGIHRCGSAQIDAPYSESDESNDASGKGTSSPVASTSGNSTPVSRCSRRAVSSCAGVGSTPTTRAPRRASQAEKYAVPQPSSTMSSPSTSPEDVQLRLGRLPRAPGDVLLRPRALGGGVRVVGVLLRPVRDVLLERSRVGQTSSSSVNHSAISRAADSGESEPCTRLSGIANGEVAADRTVAARRRDSSRRSSCAASRSRPRPRRRARASAPEVMKSTSSPKNGFSLVLGVVRLAELAVDLDQLAARAA